MSEPDSAASHSEPEEHRDSILPRRFGRYLLFERIGRGGMADIYLASARTGLGGSRRVVVKRILPELAADAEFSHLLSTEAKLAAQLQHANIVQVFDLGREDEALYIAMEYVEGFDLNQLLRMLSSARIPLPAEFAFFVVTEALRGLDYAHRARDDEGRPLRLVHRDVSPSNVLISFEGEVKLCDFGIARALAASSREHPSESAVQRVRRAGKSAYMAPEQARGENVDPRADVFAAGILLWELCAGRRLYKGSDAEILSQVQRADIPPLPERGLPQHERVQEIVDRALATSPEDRYGSCGEMLRDLERYVADVRLGTSPLRLGAFLTEHLAGDIVEVRRARERAAGALEKGPPVVMTTIGSGDKQQQEQSSESSERAETQRSAEQASGHAPAQTSSGSVAWLVWLVLFALVFVGVGLYFGIN